MPLTSVDAESLTLTTTYWSGEDEMTPDSFTVAGREIYLSYPGGSGRSRLTLDYLEKALGVTGTARNWRTVQRLAGLLEV